ncbi:MAG: S16 family serine protease [Verrucomicrobiota bacterium]
MTATRTAPTLVIAVCAIVFSSIPLARGSTFESLNCLAADDILAEVRASAAITESNLSSTMVDIALNTLGTPEVQAKALALAWVAGNAEDRIRVMEVDFYLRQGSFPSDNIDYRGIPSSSRLDLAQIRCRQILDTLDSDPGMKTLGLMIRSLNSEISNQDPDQTPMDESQKREVAAVWEVLGQSKQPSPSTSTTSGTETPIPVSDSSLVGRQGSLHGLLVMELEGSEYAGEASKMDIMAISDPTVLPEAPISFNQSVGPHMEGALREVTKYLSQRHQKLPTGVRLEISFAERSSIKDGPSAAVACALLTESILTNTPLNRMFAVTGDMNADGAVQPVGGIDGKIRGAVRTGCSHMAIPKANQSLISDLLILGGVQSLCRIQVFTITEFDEAWKLALAPDQQDAAVSQSLALFNEVKEVLSRPGGQSYLTNPHVKERLSKILELTPNHLTARLLLLASQGQAPQKLSLIGSFQTIDRCAKPLIEFGDAGDFDASLDALKGAVVDLQRVRTLLDPRTKGASDATEDLMSTLGELGNGSLVRGSARYTSIVSEIDAALGKLKAEYARIRNDPQIQEELNY